MEKKENEGNSSAAQRIMGKLKENKMSLHIARIPPKTREKFIAIADEEFCGDYGMLLKALIDDTIDQDMRMVITTLENHEARIVSLESNVPEKKESKKEVIKMCNGKEVKKR